MGNFDRLPPAEPSPQRRLPARPVMCRPRRNHSLKKPSRECPAPSFWKSSEDLESRSSEVRRLCFQSRRILSVLPLVALDYDRVMMIAVMVMTPVVMVLLHNYNLPSRSRRDHR